MAIAQRLHHFLDVANSVARQVMVTGGPLSPLFVDHSMMSRFEILSVPRARETSLALGGSRNESPSGTNDWPGDDGLAPKEHPTELRSAATTTILRKGRSLSSCPAHRPSHVCCVER